MDPAAIRRCDVPVDSPSLDGFEFGFGAMFEAVKGGAVNIPVGYCFTTCCPVAVGSTARFVLTGPSWWTLVIMISGE